ncbi:MAG: hypothetical protein CM15mP58_07440 [Burkholderiaceae bacterium]|nr:MAG: hypothetical protein CM15mP58_07440 [Burkholderiaceae bacterium]
MLGFFFLQINKGKKLVEKFFWSEGKRKRVFGEFKKTGDNEWGGTSNGVMGFRHGVARETHKRWSIGKTLLYLRTRF